MANVTVKISDDNATLGQDATDAEMVLYTHNLATLLSAQFPQHTFDVETALDPAITATDDDAVEEVEEFVTDLQSSELWTGLLEMPRLFIFKGSSSDQLAANGDKAAPALYYYEPYDYDGDVLWCDTGYPTARAAWDAAVAADWSEQMAELAANA